MTDFVETWAASRRLFILRLLVELGSEANESVIASAARAGGFHQASRDDIRADLDLLNERGATSQQWVASIRIVQLTERGEDCAWGRVTIAGVQHEVWRRART
jgi:hypothetical protein